MIWGTSGVYSVRHLFSTVRCSAALSCSAPRSSTVFYVSSLLLQTVCQPFAPSDSIADSLLIFDLKKGGEWYNYSSVLLYVRRIQQASLSGSKSLMHAVLR